MLVFCGEGLFGDGVGKFGEAGGGGFEVFFEFGGYALLDYEFAVAGAGGVGLGGLSACVVQEGMITEMYLSIAL